jgi:uncharacterized membrane protein (DUF485 family)
LIILIIFGIVNSILQIIGLKNDNIVLLLLSDCSILLVMIPLNISVFPRLIKSLKYVDKKFDKYTELIFLILLMIVFCFVVYLRLNMFIEYTTNNLNNSRYINTLGNDIFIKIIFSFLPSGFYTLRKNNREQVKKDLKENKQEYLDIIELLTRDYQYLANIEYKEITHKIRVSTFKDSKEDFNSSTYIYEPFKDLDEIEKLTDVEKELIRLFVLNRDSKEVRIINKIQSEGIVYFEFWGNTFIIYKDGYFNIILVFWIFKQYCL